MSFRSLEVSNPLLLSNNCIPDPINIIYQFYIPENEERYIEIKECLLKNVSNKNIDNVFLLNEREYTKQELGLTDTNKVTQIIINKRLSFANTFELIKERNINGYNIIINGDIFVDNDIKKLHFSQLSFSKIIMTQLRHNYKSGTALSTAKLFGPRYDSQDAWIIHSNQNIDEKYYKLFNFNFGVPGCDNKLLYLFKILGYTLINDPLTIKIYHLHKDIVRNYGKPIHPPWALIMPANIKTTNNFSTLGIDVITAYNLSNKFRNFSFSDDNILLGKYILDKFSKNQKFIIPRIAGIENNYAIIGSQIKNRSIQDHEIQYINKTMGIMKKNAGIQLTDITSIHQYSNLYLKAFDNCDVYTGWEPWGDVYKWIKDSHNEIRKNYSNKKIVWAFVFDIFHYIHSNPWTHTFKNKRILIISPFADSMREKDSIRDKIYGVELFPNCKLMYIKPPQTQADEPSQAFIKELENFYLKLDAISGNYDVALVSAGGYGNLICNHIYETGHSAIYVGGVLQMYFGILGQRWLRERPDILRCYMNEHWTRPKNTEKPRNFNTVEQSCYW